MKRDFDTAAATWDDNPARVAITRRVSEAMIAQLPLAPGMKLLDYGCGTGLVTLALQPQVGEIVAADSSAGMLAALRGKIESSGLPNVRTLPVDLEAEDLAEGGFDVIVSSMTLHHIQQADLVVRKLAQALVEGGLLAIADLDAGSEAFHPDNTGVMHYGFGVDRRQEMFQAAWLREIRTVEAARFERPGADGVLREFRILLTIGRR